ncbi:MAG: response regulator [Bacteroidetes bacterium]|nr:response regulator [Bacteroidota bacterium]
MSPKILLVDDREDNLISMESILSQDGYRFVIANSGRMALKILLTEVDFALILMDVKMPTLNGFDTAALIYEREKLRHIPIIFITANNYGEENVFQAYRTGAVDYIYKPVNPDLLRVKVSVFVDLYKKNHQLLAQEQKLMAINKNLELEINERKISEQKITELNRQLLENISNLESANKELDLFAFMASHDLQEPLRKIRFYCDRLIHRYHDNLEEDGKNDIGRIQRLSERMQTMIKDILSFSKISADEQPLIRTDLNIIVDEVLSDLETEIHNRKAQIKKETLPSLHVNAALMRLLFINLIGNALKFSKKEVQPVIKISADSNFPEEVNGNGSSNNYSRIIIEDNGIGFEQKYAKQIFDMFRRLNGKSEFEGTGIGLALCKRIVEKHRGVLSAKSQPGEGATFIISLPEVAEKKTVSSPQPLS